MLSIWIFLFWDRKIGRLLAISTISVTAVALSENDFCPIFTVTFRILLFWDRYNRPCMNGFTLFVMMVELFCRDKRLFVFRKFPLQYFVYLLLCFETWDRNRPLTRSFNDSVATVKLSGNACRSISVTTVWVVLVFKTEIGRVRRAVSAFPYRRLHSRERGFVQFPVQGFGPFCFETEIYGGVSDWYRNGGRTLRKRFSTDSSSDSLAILVFGPK